MPGAVAFVLKGYPRLSETFIAQEIHGLERAGLDIRIVSLRHPTDAATHPIHGEIAAPVVYLPEYLHREPWRILRAAVAALRLPGWRKAVGLFLRDLRRDPTRNRIRRFGQAAVLARELAPDIVRLHAHFLHTPASVARYAATLRGLPWSVSAHARDIWTSPDWELREKLADCRWAVTCSQAAHDRLAALAGDPARIALVYHGLDLGRFAPEGGARPDRDGGTADDPVVLLTVARAVEKKGLGVLIEALALLPPGLAWRWVHVGGGPLRRVLQARAAAAGLAGRIDWRGSRTQREVLAQYRAADLFVLASRVAGDGDRDGLPNVLLEAQSQGLACVATAVSAVPELIRDGVNGRLVRPDDPGALAAALVALIADPKRRRLMGEAGRRIVHDRFAADAGIARLAGMFAEDGLMPAAEIRPLRHEEGDRSHTLATGIR